MSNHQIQLNYSYNTTLHFKTLYQCFICLRYFFILRTILWSTQGSSVASISVLIRDRHTSGKHTSDIYVLLHCLSLCTCHWPGKDPQTWVCNTPGLTTYVKWCYKSQHSELHALGCMSLTVSLVLPSQTMRKIEASFPHLDKWSRTFLRWGSVKGHKKCDTES